MAEGVLGQQGRKRSEGLEAGEDVETSWDENADDDTDMRVYIWGQSDGQKSPTSGQNSPFDDLIKLYRYPHAQEDDELHDRLTNSTTVPVTKEQKKWANRILCASLIKRLEQDEISVEFENLRREQAQRGRKDSNETEIYEFIEDDEDPNLTKTQRLELEYYNEMVSVMRTAEYTKKWVRDKCSIRPRERSCADPAQQGRKDSNDTEIYEFIEDDEDPKLTKTQQLDLEYYNEMVSAMRTAEYTKKWVRDQCPIRPRERSCADPSMAAGTGKSAASGSRVATVGTCITEGGTSSVEAGTGAAAGETSATALGTSTVKRRTMKSLVSSSTQEQIKLELSEFDKEMRTIAEISENILDGLRKIRTTVSHSKRTVKRVKFEHDHYTGQTTEIMRMITRNITTGRLIQSVDLADDELIQRVEESIEQMCEIRASLQRASRSTINYLFGAFEFF